MHPVIIALHSVDAFIRCIQRYYVGSNHVIYNAARTGELRGGSLEDGAHLRTDRSLNCFVASSRRNSPVLHFSSRSVQVSTCTLADEKRFYRAYSAQRVLQTDRLALLASLRAAVSVILKKRDRLQVRDTSAFFHRDRLESGSARAAGKTGRATRRVFHDGATSTSRDRKGESHLQGVVK